MEKTPHGYAVVTPEEVAKHTATDDDAPLLLDVRTPGEFAAYHVPGALLIPVDELGRRYQELDPDRPTICICEHGIRSEAAAAFLAGRDFAEVATMRGGMSRWTGEVERG
jgi:rhodanese-related sulfurtransferase